MKRKVSRNGNGQPSAFRRLDRASESTNRFARSEVPVDERKWEWLLLRRDLLTVRAMIVPQGNDFLHFWQVTLAIARNPQNLLGQHKPVKILVR
jgi:hypothetical protein